MMASSRPLAYILTHHWIPNFGANLQAYASMRAIESRGVDVRFVDFRPRELVERYAARIPDQQRQMHDEFVHRHFPMTERIETQAEFETLCGRNPADIYVTGSDAVFRMSGRDPRADFRFPNPFWLVGARGPDGNSPRKIALAPSAMGARFSEMSQGDQDGMLSALRDIDPFSVRDDWTRLQVRALGYRQDIPLVPDPVFALASEVQSMRSQDADSKPYIVICTQQKFTSAWVKTFTEIAQDNGYDTVALPLPEGVVDRETTRLVELPLDPLVWLSILAGSSGYIGVRFHPVVVSLLANVPVVSLDLYHSNPINRRRSKTWLLMRQFGNAGSCYGRSFHRFLTPKKAWRQLRRQRGHERYRSGVADQLGDLLEGYLDQAFGPVCRED